MKSFIIQRSFHKSYHACTDQGSFSRSFLTNSELRVNNDVNNDANDDVGNYVDVSDDANNYVGANNDVSDGRWWCP